LDRLAGSFFFSRNDARLRDPLAVIPTLAYDIAHKLAAFRALICSGVDGDPFVRRKTIEIQGQTLFGQLGQVAQPEQQLLLVLDAMDECDCSDRADYARLVAVMISMPNTFKVLITSRSADHFKELFGSHDAKRLALHYDIADHVVRSDIHLYLQQQLGNLALMRRLPTPFPKQEELVELVKRAGTLFIYAATVVKWISDIDQNPVVQLSELMHQNTDDAQFQYRTLDILYAQVLSQAAKTNNDPAKHVQAIRTVISAVVLLQEPLPATAITYITSIKQTDMLLSRLSAVIMTDSHTYAVRPYHASFPDFITNSSRCLDECFLIAPAKGHEFLAICCLQLLNDGLRRDICDIRNHSLRNNEVSDLSQRLNDLPVQLRYACKHWHTHIRSAGEPSDSLIEHLRVFCEEHLHHWLELLSLMKELWLVVADITPLITFLRVCTILD
jgi:hypothetical protein